MEDLAKEIKEHNKDKIINQLQRENKKLKETMKLREAQDEEDILMLLMVSERDKQIKMLEKENADLKRLLIEVLQENKHLEKVVNKLKSKRNGGTYDKK